MECQPESFTINQNYGFQKPLKSIVQCLQEFYRQCHKLKLPSHKSTPPHIILFLFPSQQESSTQLIPRLTVPSSGELM